MKTQNEQVSRTRDYRTFYALLREMRGGVPEDELKETWVSNYTNGRTTSAQEMTNVEFALMLGAMELHVRETDPKYVELNKWRKRVMAAIVGWLKSRNRTENAAVIKAIACRAAGKDDFNKIPLNRLRAIYGEWCGKNKVSVETVGIMKEFEGSLAMMN